MKNSLLFLLNSFLVSTSSNIGSLAWALFSVLFFTWASPPSSTLAWTTDILSPCFPLSLHSIALRLLVQLSVVATYSHSGQLHGSPSMVMVGLLVAF